MARDLLTAAADAPISTEQHPIIQARLLAVTITSSGTQGSQDPEVQRAADFAAWATLPQFDPLTDQDNQSLASRSAMQGNVALDVTAELDTYELGVGLRELRRHVELRLLSRKDATAWLLERFRTASSADVGRVKRTLLLVSDADTVLDVALEVYALEGLEDWLATGADAVEAFGARGWATLVWLVGSRRGEVEYFVHTIANCSGVDRSERVSVLEELAGFHDPLVRARVLDVALDSSLQDSERLLRALARGPMDETTHLARGELEFLQQNGSGP
ncbi:MAG: hypothetical protein O7H41_16085 [Planctomycetota bacterium]|nr:hypothetical protein [Planctomycetota bacterium]